MAGRDGEVEASAVQDTGGYCNLKLVTPEFSAAALASDTWLCPRLAAAAAVVARPAHGHLEWHHRAVPSLALRQLDRRAQCRSPLVGEKGAPHALDRGCHRWKIDNDLIREAARVRTTVGVANGGRCAGTEGTKGVFAHER